MKFGGNWLWFLKNHDFIHVNSAVVGKYNKYKQDDGHLRFPIRTIFGQMSIYLPSPMAYAKIQPQGILSSGEHFQRFLPYMGMAAILVNKPRPF